MVDVWKRTRTPAETVIAMARKPATGRTRANDPVGLRKRVLDAAAGAFQAYGYHSTTTHDIVREAGVTGGALHHHFATKKELGVAVIRERVAQAVEQSWMEPVRSARTAAEGIQTAFEQIASAFDRRATILGCPVNNLALELSLADSEFRHEIDGIFARWREAIAQKLRADIANDVLEDLDPEAFATFVIASYSGAVTQAKASQATAPLRACARQLAFHMRSGGSEPSRTRRSHDGA
jgi:AcrR family transcriptional regulator